MTPFRLWAAAAILSAVLFFSIGLAQKAVAPRCQPYMTVQR